MGEAFISPRPYRVALRYPIYFATLVWPPDGGTHKSRTAQYRWEIVTACAVRRVFKSNKDSSGHAFGLEAGTIEPV